MPVFQGVVGNALYTVCVLIFGGAVTYLSYNVPGWGTALLRGFWAALAAILVTLAWRIMQVVPARRQPITTENIEEKIKEWLYKHNLTIKNDPTESSYFRLLVTTEGGCKVFISRNKKVDSASLIFHGELHATDAEITIAETFTDEEKLTFLLDLRLELSRANVSYSGLDYSTGFVIAKSLPISADLNEFEVMKLLWELEAVINSALVIVLIAAQRYRLRQRQLD